MERKGVTQVGHEGVRGWLGKSTGGEEETKGIHACGNICGVYERVWRGGEEG